MKRCVVWMVVVLGWVGGLCGAQGLQVVSPDGQTAVRVFVNAGGRLCWSARRQGPSPAVLLQASPLGLTLDGVDVGQGVALGEARRTERDRRYACRGGHAEARDRFQGAEVPVTHRGSGRSFVLELRVFDDGFAVRYRVPATGPVTIGPEATAWTLPPGCRLWYQTNIKNYEGLFTESAPEALALGRDLGLPVTVVYPDGRYGALTEAALFAYSGMSLRATGTTRLQGVCADDASWRETGPFQTPWRVTLTGPDLTALVNADVVTNLCPEPDPALFPDGGAWVHPGRSLWNWWCNSPVTFATQPRWVDETAALGFEYYLVDAGWEKAWSAGGHDPWARLAELCAYGRSHQVGINVWKRWNELADPAEREDFLARCARAGAAGLKVDFMDSESRARIDFYTSVLTIAARHHLLVNFHGANKPTGESRRFPNEVTREGIRGLEYNRWSALPPAHYAALPFTRYLAGHGDFTPCTFDPQRLKGTTAGLQLASAVVITSPLLHWADHWQRYRESPARDLIASLPSVWDETRVLPGSRIGDLAVLARRRERRWFVGIVNGASARSYTLSLDFLGAGSYRATLAEDNPEDPAALHVSGREVTRASRIHLDLATGGGATLRLVPGGGG